MDDTGRARLTDFSFTTVTSDPGSAVSIREGQAVRWAAPEILDKERPVSKESDVHSFAMVLIEVWVHNLYPNNLRRSSIQGIYRRGTISWYCTYHSGRWHYIREATAATNTPEFD